ncbi:AraC-like DNA-binding protein [Pullulanibacillus pueri]|uniref:AraC family transcriptional regulator n=1 Tax=Pullulanibacillus pueri TaxID=1437324 RepID=A0A8J2ZUW5_9BACL|nr:helix-turn-helix domain-containing protein [Pullulanibacillus pueri]MBM7682050.1 AraC-like DNA-binding protein [Pullulanibacillus pueri]GGH80169.1 AraC family transcriptional regulator [Pullulanibacillus pueri]
MLSFNSVNFDNFIPNWRTHMEIINFNVLVLIVQGKALYTVNGKQIVAESGDVLFIPQTTKRAGENYEARPHQKYTVLFNHDQEDNEEISFLRRNQFFKLKTRHFEYVKHRCERLYAELRGNKEHRSYICKGILQELIGMLAREKDHPTVTPMKLRYAQIMKQYLLDNYRETIEIEQLAKLIHRSPNYTISVFKEVTGKAPIQYIHQLRIIEACNLLLHSDMTIAAIANYLGYYDASYFSRMFKRLTTKSPKAFMMDGHMTEIGTLFS